MPSQLVEVEATRDLTQSIVHVDMDAFVRSHLFDHMNERLTCSPSSTHLWRFSEIHRSRARHLESAKGC